MKNKSLVSGIIILTVLSIFLSIYSINLNKKYEQLKTKYETIKKDRLDTITLKPKESVKIVLGEREYTLKLLRIEKDPMMCVGFVEPCTKQADYAIGFTINGIEFYLDSNLNYSAEIITINFSTDYIIYYVPEYNDEEATFFIEKDENYKKENNLIIGNYIVYVDDNNKVIDINTFDNVEQCWGKNYIGQDLEDIGNMIDKGENLHKSNQ